MLYELFRIFQVGINIFVKARKKFPFFLVLMQTVTPVVKPDGQGDGEHNDEDFDEDFFQLVQPIFFGIFCHLVSGLYVFDDLVF